jgi:tRNA A-37 threonylcarbamoyl transferase component Bud32
MTAADPHLADLSDDERRVVEAWLVDFDLSWGGRPLKDWVRKLPPTGDRLRRAALVEMVKIDLERHWQRGRPAHLEAYLRAAPELGPASCLPADLLLAEYEARRECGAPADLAEFAKRFPRQAGELRRLVEVGAPSQAPSGGSSIPPDARTPLPVRPAPGAGALPAQFGRYRILRKLGQGAMAAVYLAHDSQLDRLVALKAPQFTAEDGPEARQRFFREARAAAAIEHPNICPVYDVGEVHGAPYLAMAYLQGQSLAQLLDPPAALPPRRAADLVRKLALALQEAHEHGVVHRDLKPSNVMINQRGEPVIVDFGLARRVRPGDVRLTQIGQPVGTPAYMSPEQVVGATELMGPGCDVYSLGVILYQLLTGRLPFEGSMAEVLGQIVSRRPDPPSKHLPGLDRRLEVICLKALSKEVAARFAGMKDFAAPLADYLGDGRPAGAPAPREPAKSIPVVGPGIRGRIAWFCRKPLWIVLVAGSAAIVALLAGVVLWTSGVTGAVRIEFDDPHAQVEVQIDGERLDGAGLHEPLRLQAGKHHLLVTGKGIEPFNEQFTVAPGDNPVLRVKLVPRAEAAEPGRGRGARHRSDDDGRDDDGRDDDP